MELEPDSWMSSSDMRQSELEVRQEDYESADTNDPTLFFPPYEINMGDPPSSDGAYQNSFFEIDPSLVDLSSFLRYDANNIPANTSSNIAANPVYGSPINRLIPSGSESIWQGAQHDTSFDLSYTAYFEGNDMLNPININTSFSEWLDSSGIDAAFSLAELNPSPNAILQECGLVSIEPAYDALSSLDILFPTPAEGMYSPQSEHSKCQNNSHDHDLLKAVDIRGVQAAPRLLPKFDDLTHNFNLSPKPPPTKRHRSGFTGAGKEKVRLVRECGACVFCRSRKVSCSAEEVCDHCRRTVEDSIIARQICVRTRLQDLYIGVKELHGPSLVAKREKILPFLKSLDGIPQDVNLWLESEANTVALSLQVLQCTYSPQGQWKSLKKACGIYITSNLLKEKRYFIKPSSLPDINHLDTFGRDILLISAGSLSGEITRLLDGFLSCYCNRRGYSQLRRLCNLTFRMASLNNFVAYGFLDLQDGSYKLLGRWAGENEPENFVSETVHDQIRIVAAEGLEPAEKYIFSELDNLPKLVGTRGHARIIAGICLLRLLLLYRDKMIRDRIRRDLPRTKSYHQTRLDKSAFMYRRLTVSFATLCREHDSPLTMTWEDEGSNEDESGSEELKTIFTQLRCAFRQFCCEKLTEEYDDVFRSLISEPFKGRKTRKRRRTVK